VHTSSTAQAAPTGTSTVSTGPVHGTLVGQNHAPIVNILWPYAVHVTDATAHPLSGSVEIEFVFGDQVVGRDTPPTHPIRNGRWQDKLTFPPQATGEPLTFRAVVHTRLGSITLDWAVTPRA
jgi:hypothetical protein